MNRARVASRSGGPGSGSRRALAIAAAVWLVSEYLYARHVTPIEKARVEALKLKAKTDAEVQKVLKPEWDRQHEELVRRRNAYRCGGLALLVALGVFFAWIRWLRPAEGAVGRRAPETRPDARGDRATGPRLPPSAGARAASGTAPAPGPPANRSVCPSGAPAGR